MSLHNSLTSQCKRHMSRCHYIPLSTSLRHPSYFRKTFSPFHIRKVSLASTSPNSTIPVSKPIQEPQYIQQIQENMTVLTAKPSIGTYLELAKPRLSVLVVLTAMASYAIAPYHTCTIGSLLCLTSGTFLCSAGANSLNQWVESDLDAQMPRTRNRPIARGAIMPHQAFAFSWLNTIAGTAILYLGVNPVTAYLGFGTFVLYALIYTPMKRFTIANTWVGSLVGALPPLMGWAACSGGDLISHPGGLCLAGILFAWQFPHFNALAWLTRADYARAGYYMMSVTNEALNARVSLRYAIACLPLCACLPIFGLVDYSFLLDSTIANAYLLYRAIQFYKSSNQKTARNLFFASLVHLPAILILALIHHIALYWLDESEGNEQSA